MASKLLEQVSLEGQIYSAIESDTIFRFIDRKSYLYRHKRVQKYEWDMLLDEYNNELHEGISIINSKYNAIYMFLISRVLI